MCSKHYNVYLNRTRFDTLRPVLTESRIAQTSMMAQTPQQTAAAILNILSTRGEADYIGEPISQIEHSLQCAHLAASNGADDATVVAALLHDIGQFLDADQAASVSGAAVVDMRGAAVSNTGKPDSGSVGRAGHDTIGAAYLSQEGFPEKVCALVVRMLLRRGSCVLLRPGYRDGLSEASKQSLQMQGGPMSDEEVVKWKHGDWWREMVELRKWDDRAKAVGLKVPGVEEYRAQVERVLMM